MRPVVQRLRALIRPCPCPQLRHHRLWPHEQGLGASYHWASQEKADSVAVQNCAQHGNDCKAVVWFKHQCGAAASGEGTPAFWGLGGSDEQARADAQSKCVNGGGQACEVRASQCSK